VQRCSEGIEGTCIFSLVACTCTKRAPKDYIAKSTFLLIVKIEEMNKIFLISCFKKGIYIIAIYSRKVCFNEHVEKNVQNISDKVST